MAHARGDFVAHAHADEHSPVPVHETAQARLSA
jgi:hypothetical protein